MRLSRHYSGKRLVLRHAVARQLEVPLFFNGTFNASLDGTYNDLR